MVAPRRLRALSVVTACAWFCCYPVAAHADDATSGEDASPSRYPMPDVTAMVLLGRARHIAFSVCMAGGRDFNDCSKALGVGNQGFGICMAAGRDVNECSRSLGSENYAFGICMAAGRQFNQCLEALKP